MNYPVVSFSNYRLFILSFDDQESSKAYYLTNGYGDVAKILYALGAVLNSYTYDIFGGILLIRQAMQIIHFFFLESIGIVLLI